jgi:hypothetical protein
MGKMIRRAGFFLLVTRAVLAQSQPFDIEGYKTFLSSNKDLSASQLINLYSAGSFGDNLNANPDGILYMDTIEHRYNLTQSEKDLIKRNGFMVTERLSHPSFGDAFAEIWRNDLPVFISTDAVLHAVHMSYDEILKSVEVQVLIPKLTSFLSGLKQQIPRLHAAYSTNPGMVRSLEDVDLYLTVAEKLLGSESSLYYAANATQLAEILGYIAVEKPVQHALFSETDRVIDYSQFKVRGHYTDEHMPQLAKYFQSMMWLGGLVLFYRCCDG